MSSSEYSGSESASESESSSSDDNAELLSRPVFLKKSTKKPEHNAPSSKVALARAEHHQQIEVKKAEKQDFDGIEDTDNLDPAHEFEMWEVRERERKQRDRKKLEEIEQEKEDALRRQMNRDHGGTGDTRDQDSNGNGSQLGVFYSSSIDGNLLKRDYRDVEDLGDHSRPTRYKRS